MLNESEMWIKLYNVLDSVATPAQFEAAYKYAELWLAEMLHRNLLTDGGQTQWADAIVSLAEREV